MDELPFINHLGRRFLSQHLKFNHFNQEKICFFLKQKTLLCKQQARIFLINGRPRQSDLGHITKPDCVPWPGSPLSPQTAQNPGNNRAIKNAFHNCLTRVGGQSGPETQARFQVKLQFQAQVCACAAFVRVPWGRKIARKEQAELN